MSDGHSQGLVAIDDHLHAGRKTLTGMAAVCGRGRILVVRHGRFDPEHNRSCFDCARTLRDAPGAAAL